MARKETLDAFLLIILIGMMAFFTFRGGGTPSVAGLGTSIAGNVSAPSNQKAPPGSGGPRESQPAETERSREPTDEELTGPLSTARAILEELGRAGGSGFPFTSDLMPPQLEAPPPETPLASSGSTSAPPPTGRRPTEEEIFRELWPESYLARLSAFERLVVRGGIILEIDPMFQTKPARVAADAPTQYVPEWFIPAEKRHASFRTDEDVYGALLNIAEERYEAGLSSRDELETARWSITAVLPQVIERDRERLRRGLSRGPFPRPEQVASCSVERRTFTGLFKLLASEFTFLKPAFAGWYTSPDCYKDDDPKYQPLGSNTQVGCCNCGFIIVCTPAGCYLVPVDDCGTGGAICDIQVGCLNGVCEDWPNAIWDEDTETCGCG